MFVTIIFITTITLSLHAGDAVSTWLQHMGCDQLLAAYYEELLENGNQKERVDAASELANLYAILLSRASASNDEPTLERAALVMVTCKCFGPFWSAVMNGKFTDVSFCWESSHLVHYPQRRSRLIGFVTCR